jgi:hypothetical protein
MKFVLRACLLFGALAAASQLMAAPTYTAFLAVDINGANTAGGQSPGPTQAGFQGWDALAITDEFDANYGADNNWVARAVPGMVKSFATSEGSITATVYGVGTSYSARNRGANTGGMTDLQQEFVFAQRDNAIAFGRNYVKLTLSGLTPNKQYGFTGFARESAFNAANLANPLDPGQSFQAWSDPSKLGASDGPAAWLDANVGAGASYQPAVGGVNNVIPYWARSQVAGPDSLSQVDTFFHSATFATTADANGVVTVYTWSDPNGFGGTVQGASLLGGFQIGNIPEPTSLVLFAIGLVGVAVRRRRAH